MPPSLDVLEDVVRREYDAQERRADSLDTKAGLVLGFAGLLVSLTPAPCGHRWRWWPGCSPRWAASSRSACSR